MTTRRNLITGSVAAIAAGALPIAAVVADEPLVALWRHYQEAETRLLAAWDHVERTGQDDFALTDPAQDAWRASIEAISNTPATSFAGLAIKLRLIAADVAEGPTDFARALVAGALADAERLAGGAP